MPLSWENLSPLASEAKGQYRFQVWKRDRAGMFLCWNQLPMKPWASFRVGVDRVEPAFKLASKIAPPCEA